MVSLAFDSFTFGGESHAPDARTQAFISHYCADCHGADGPEAGLSLAQPKWNLDHSGVREGWVRVYDRVRRFEMPPDPDQIPNAERTKFLSDLKFALVQADREDIRQRGRGPMRRLTRDEFQQNLRDILKLPLLDIRDRLPEDREGFHLNKTSEVLDLSRVQLNAYLDAAEAALFKAVATAPDTPETYYYRAIGRNLFTPKSTFGNREAMFFAKDSLALDNKLESEWQDDESVELALFRSATWPYFGYPREFVARKDGEYLVRFSARAVTQLPGYRLEAAKHPVPMTFRARKPSGADVSGDVRATGGIWDIQPEQTEFETKVLLKAGETLEYSLLGLPMPLARNVDGGEPSYRYPPFPPEGQPGVAIQKLEITGPLQPDHWPPASHRVLFGNLPLRAAPSDSALSVEVVPNNVQADASRLLRSFIARAARAPVSEASIEHFEQLILSKLDSGAPFTEAMLIAYQAFLCSSHFLYLHEPHGEQDHFVIASRLSHLLTNTRPDEWLISLAEEERLRDCQTLKVEADRMIRSPDIERFVNNFTDYWLDLRHLYRDEPDILRYPEYRLDHYLVESMERETRAFFLAMIRENLPVSVVINADFAFVNDRLADHYEFPPVDGSGMRKVPVPPGSPYGGLLTQAAILKVTANGTSTSPVVRGAWVMDRLLGQRPPPPPPNVPAVEPDIRGANSIRELLALHTKSAACAGCHSRFEPVGHALENFDILGGWRTRYRGLEQGELVTGIDRAGHDFAYTLVGLVDGSGQLLHGERFDDINELKQILAADPRQLARNLLHQFALYGTGTPVRFSERDEVERILDDCQQSDYRVGDLLQGMITSPIFLGEPGCLTERQ
ncbi:DUF1592 domain-containing protein [Planctomicrobium sp. SH664]|uniref:DUF1592 domain-containing protein n=1 Tax=Planctomicrobium sp. SH664 TaxID=3448125 RepID=UPI003F5B60A8